MNELLKSYTIKNIDIRNRIVMPPMVCFQWSDELGIVSAQHVEHYAKRAKAQTGIIVVEATCVSSDGKLNPRQLGIWNDSQIAGLSELAAVIRRNGSVAMLQLHHAGFPGDGVSAVGREDLARIRGDFLDGFIRARKAGFDGAEFHGAHGYLISQMLSPLRNHREDEYGGSLDGRFRFVEELLEEVHTFDNSRFIIGYRMGGNEPGIVEGILIAKKLRTAGIDLLHVSLGIEEPDNPVVVPTDFNFSKIIYIGSKIKESV
ncbi:MAG: NADH:flavin oxidoreductase, partial [Saccharofermentanales bacterium]